MTTGKPADQEPLETVDDPIGDVVDTGATAPAPAPRQEREPKDIEREKAEKPLSAREEKMAAIAARVKEKRSGIDATGDFADPTQTYGSFAQPAADEPAPEPEAPPAPAEPRKFKLKVRGQEIEKTEDEVLATAQKVLAADDYLEEARRIHDQAKKQARTPADRPHQDDNGAHDDPDHVPEPQPHDPHQGSGLKQVIEDIQYGDPEEAAEKLKTSITKEVNEQTKVAVLTEKLNADLEGTQLAFERFKADNKDLVADENATAVMERMLYDGYREDLLDIGVPEDRLPPRHQLPDWHRFYRVSGRKVRSADKLFTDVKEQYVGWRGGTPKPQDEKPTPAARPGQPRVAVDRTERRASIPTQPTRATNPPAHVPTAPQPRSRSAVIQEMKAKRFGRS